MTDSFNVEKPETEAFTMETVPESESTFTPESEKHEEIKPLGHPELGWPSYEDR